MFLVYLLLRLLALLPLRALHGVGAGFGRLRLRLGGRTVRNTAVNLRIARPQLDGAAQSRLLRQVMTENGKSGSEIVKVWGAGAERALALVREVRGEALLDAALAAGGTVGILPDQKPRAGEGEFAPFFGRDALTMVLLPRLAARTGASVLYAFAERLPRGAGFRIHLLPAPADLTDADPAIACGALNQGVQECVELAFAQYQWQYKRYSAHGRPSPYDRGDK